MNLHRTTPASFFCFDESAAGTGGASSPPGGTASPAASPAPSSTPAPAATPSGSPSGTPAAQPSTPSAGAGVAPSESEAHDPFAGLDMDFGDLDEVILPGQPPGTTPGTAPSAAPAAPTAQPVAPQEPTPPPAQPAAPASAPQPPAPGTVPASPRDQLRQTVEGFKNNAADLSKWAAGELFKLSDEEVTALTTDAPSAIPQIAGRVYAQSLAAAANLIQNLVPSLVEQIVDQQHGARTRASEAMNQFWTENKDLNAKDHGALVSAWAKQFRQANPQASRAEAIAFVARAVRVQAGLPQPGTVVPPAAPSVPPAFAPARPGGRTPPAPAEHDPFWGLGHDFDDTGAPT